MKPITGNIAIEGKNIVKDFKIGETTTRVLKKRVLKSFKGRICFNYGTVWFRWQKV